MTVIIWSPQSLRDLEGIRAYVAQDSPRYAELVVQRIVSAVERLQDFPVLLGGPRGRLQPTYSMVMTNRSKGGAYEPLVG